MLSSAKTEKSEVFVRTCDDVLGVSLQRVAENQL